MNDKFNTELTKTMRRKSSGNMSSASSSSTSSSFSGESSPGVDLGPVSEVEAHLIDMAENAKQRRRGRSKSVPQIKRVRSSSTGEPIDLTVNTKMDARSFQEMPSTSLCSTELWSFVVDFVPGGIFPTDVLSVCESITKPWRRIKLIRDKTASNMVLAVTVCATTFDASCEMFTYPPFDSSPFFAKYGKKSAKSWPGCCHWGLSIRSCVPSYGYRLLF